jgi:hypothetical protein
VVVTPRAPLRPCGNTRCKRQVFDATIVKARGAPVAVVLDAEPSTWANGARIKLIESGHLPGGQQHADKLTAAQIHRAFAVTHLYVEHAEVCQAEQRKKKAKKADGSHA